VLTFTPPLNGTIVSRAGIVCGTRGSRCAANVVDSTDVTFESLPDPTFQFFRYTGDCAPVGTLRMTKDITCGAEFAPVPKDQPASLRAVTNNAERATGTRTGGAGTRSVDLRIETAGGRGDESEFSNEGSNRGNGVSQGLPRPLLGAIRVEPEPEHPEMTARRLIEAALASYCKAQEAMSPEAVRNVVPTANLDQLRYRFRQFKSVRCTVPQPPVYEQLDYVNGKATVKVGVKQTQTPSIGGIEIVETIMTAELSRPGIGADHWVIDVYRHERK
jgi:hypothetical protein